MYFKMLWFAGAYKSLQLSVIIENSIETFWSRIGHHG